MLARNNPKACLLPAVVAVSLVAANPGAVGQEADPVQELRQRQQRLSDLEYAIKEAELLRRLCDLSPENPECIATTPEIRGDAHMPASIPGRNYRLVEVFGSENRLQAVLVEPGGGRRIAQAGTELSPDTVVDRILPHAVQLLTPSGISTLRVGDE